jgi:LPS-assembly protein
LGKHWSSYSFNLVAQRSVNYQTNIEGDKIVIRKLPEAQFTAREQPIGKLPVWVSLDSSFGLERRSQPLFQTRQFVQRADFAPRLMTAFHWLGFDLAPSFGIRETLYDSSVNEGRISGRNLVRSTQDITLDLAFPALSRIFQAPKWMRAGEQVKHVIEPRATYRYVRGLGDFNQVLRFDEVDIVSNTHEVEFSLTNRILRREGAGGVSDLLSWQLFYKRYFDPTFGGAAVPGRRNVVESALDLTGYAFLNGPRNQSPVVSVLRIQSRVGVQWRADYDPVRRAIVNSGVSVDGRFGQVFLSAGHYQLRTDPVLAPNSNQLRTQITYGGDNRRGWNYGYSAFYDYKAGSLQFTQAQVTYNTDCCGFSVQHRQFNFAVRPENQFRVAFALSNIGSFGTLRKQERIF